MPDTSPTAAQRRRVRAWRALARSAPAAAGVAVAARAATAQRSPYSVGFTADAATGTISNAQYRAGGDSTDVVSRAQLGVSVTRYSRRTHVTAGANGEWQHYRVTAGLSQFTYGAAAAADHRVTPRLTITGGVSARTQLTRGVGGAGVVASGTDDATAPGDEGEASGGGPGSAPGSATIGGTNVVTAALPLLPLTLTHTYTASGGAAFRLSPRTALSAEAGATRVSFDRPGVIGGSTQAARAHALHQLTSDDVVGVSAGVERSALDGRPLATTSALVEWTTARLPQALVLRVALGASEFSSAPGSHLVRPIGSGSLAGHAVRGTWETHYARSISPVIGVGQTLVTDQVGASYARVVPGGITAVVGIDRAWIGVPGSAGQRFTTNVSSASVQRAIVAGLWAGASGAQYSRAEGVAIRSRDLTVRAGYAFGWGALPAPRPSHAR